MANEKKYVIIYQSNQRQQDADCSDVLIRLAAVRSAINSTGKVVLKNHLNHCIVEAVEEHGTEAIEKLNQAIDKLMK